MVAAVHTTAARGADDHTEARPMANQNRRFGKSASLFLTMVLLCSFTQRGEAEDMPDSAHIHHAIDYIEFTVTDMDKAKRFYEAAFDWKFNDYGPEYAGIQKEGGEAGGLRLASEVVTGGPLVVLYSDDLDMTLSSVREAGGQITTEPFDFPGGRRFHFKDPSGNELAVYSTK